MREILFRGKDADGEWVYGAYLHQTLFYGDPIDKHWIIEHGEFDYDCYYSHKVIPETVGQYTGLTDKNGTKIFEGDIIQYCGTYPLEVFIEEGHTKIRWFDSATKSKCSQLFFGGNDEAYGEFEVIGNIHDNPELLEVQSNV